MLVWLTAVVASGGGCSDERVVLEHSVVAADRPGFLRLRGERAWVPGLGAALAGCKVEVRVEGGGARCVKGDSFSDSLSDSFGDATVGIGTLAVGNHPIRVVFGGARREAVAYSWAKGTPVIVCDIDGTIYFGGDWGGGAGGEFAGIANPENAAPGASVALKELSRDFGIVYLTAREEVFRGKTEQFLRMAGFPPGPLVMWDATQDPVSRAALKKRRLRRLMADWPEVVWGIGDRWSDVEAYRAVGCGVVLIDRGQSEEVQTRVEGQEYAVRGWKEIAALIRKGMARAGTRTSRQAGAGQ